MYRSNIPLFLKEYELAIVNLEKSIEHNSKFIESYNMLALVYDKIRNIEMYNYYTEKYSEYDYNFFYNEYIDKHYINGYIELGLK